MDIYNVIMRWDGADGLSHESKFNCNKGQVIAQINQALNSEVANAFQSTIEITVKNMGPLRGPAGGPAA